MYILFTNLLHIIFVSHFKTHPKEISTGKVRTEVKIHRN